MEPRAKTQFPAGIAWSWVFCHFTLPACPRSFLARSLTAESILRVCLSPHPGVPWAGFQPCCFLPGSSCSPLHIPAFCSSSSHLLPALWWSLKHTAIISTSGNSFFTDPETEASPAALHIPLLPPIHHPLEKDDTENGVAWLSSRIWHYKGPKPAVVSQVFHTLVTIILLALLKSKGSSDWQSVGSSPTDLPQFCSIQFGHKNPPPKNTNQQPCNLTASSGFPGSQQVCAQCVWNRSDFCPSLSLHASVPQLTLLQSLPETHLHLLMACRARRPKLLFLCAVAVSERWAVGTHVLLESWDKSR